ncbi:secretion and cellular translocation J domain protein, partial [Chlamydia psittaci 84-8471/1]
FKSGWSS